MKIAYLFSRYPVPSQTFCDTEIRALEAAGHEIEIYSCSPPTTSFRHGGPGGWPRAPVLYAPPPPVLDAWDNAAQRDGTWPAEMIAEHKTRFGLRYDPARRARHALYFADRVRRRGVEHLHVHFTNRATHAALFMRALTGIPFSFTAHAQDFLVDLGSDDLLRRMCDRAAFVVAVSDWSHRALLEKCPAVAGKLHRVYNGLPLDRWPLREPRLTSPGDGLKIFSLGRLIDFKGFGDLLTACRSLQARGIPFSCEIAGEGPLRETLQRQADQFDDPRARVSLLGLLAQDEVRVRLETCDVFALACRVDEKGACDVLPTVILEAMASAKPVVSTRLAAVPEMVEEGRTGFLSPPGDPAALADSLARVASLDADARRRMGLSGRDKLISMFTAEQSAARLITLFGRAGATGGFEQGTPPANLVDANTLILFDQWPPESVTDGNGALSGENFAEACQKRPDLHLLALKPGDFEATVPGGAPFGIKLLQTVEFLPDEMILETYWRGFGSLAHRMESWRSEVGGACETGVFLHALRRALYLQCTKSNRPSEWRHLHAVGPQSLLCAWILIRLEFAQSASFMISAQSGGGIKMVGSTLRKLAPGFIGGWVTGERKLAASLGSNFSGEAADLSVRISKLDEWMEKNRRDGRVSAA